ncbi:MAG: FAD-dependent oxidoreductase [Pseudomonadota bacterium]
MHSQNIAVIGSGIAGLSSSWLLSKNHKVTLFEANAKVGGHTNTATIDVSGQPVAVDTGFICFNSATYPNLVALFDHLKVPVHNTDMSFAASLYAGAYEYCGGTLLGMVAQPSNIFSIRHWRMIRDILRFFKEAPASIEKLDDDTTLMEYLERERYSTEFIDWHLMPMAAAIWSSRADDMTGYPAKSFIRFFQNHALLQVSGRPLWGTVKGGSQVYVDKLLADANINIRVSSPARKIERTPMGVRIHTPDGPSELFDQVVIASHADDALRMLDTPSAAEQALLGAFSYAQNHAVLHQDRRLMPKRKATWASWNYVDFETDRSLPLSERDLCVSYWMNSLQSLTTREDVFVTLNPPQDMTIENVHGRYDYSHPIFDAAAMQAQREIWSIQGDNRTWYCGAHFGSGFHEDGLQSGLAVAEQLGGERRPWDVADESGRIHVHAPAELREAAE